MRIKIKKYKKVKSTNDIALRLIKQNISDPTFIIAERQTGGRGNSWKKMDFKKRQSFHFYIF